MTLNDATAEYTQAERKRILGEAARFNGHVDTAVEKLENKINEIYSAQAELYNLCDEDILDEKDIKDTMHKLFKLGVVPAMDVSSQTYYS